MNRSFNSWWLLPVVTSIFGGVLAFILHEPSTVISAKAIPVNTPVLQELSITKVALPPAPIVYQPTLTASLHNDKVMLKNSSQKTSFKKESQNTSRTNDVVLNDEQSALAKQFSQVMQDMVDEDKEPQTEETLHAQALTLYPQWYQNLVPALEFTTHIYSSEKNERWVRVNHQVVKEGELITSEMRLVSIEPQQVIIEMQKRRFTLSALSSW